MSVIQKIGQRAEQLRFALQLFVSTLDEKSILQVATIFDKWDPHARVYEQGDYLIYGENSVGDPQLYVVTAGHISKPQQKPNVAKSLYRAIGVTESGHPEWSQPVGIEDAYDLGDVVSMADMLFESVEEQNTSSPLAKPDAWRMIENKEQNTED